MDNSITIVGNVTREPELKYLPSNTPVAQLGVAVNKRFKRSGSDEWEETTSFFDVSIFGDMAENVATSVAKGTRVIVTGELEQQTWNDKTTGDKRSKVQIKASEVGIALRFATVGSVARTAKKGEGNRTPVGVGASNGDPFGDDING